MNEYPYGSDVSRGIGTAGAAGASGVGGFMIGALVGAGIALLLAPATGGETRRRIGDTARKIGSAAREKFGEVGERVGQTGQKLTGSDNKKNEPGREPYMQGRPNREIGSRPGQTGRHETGSMGQPA